MNLNLYDIKMNLFKQIYEKKRIIIQTLVIKGYGQYL